MFEIFIFPLVVEAICKAFNVDSMHVEMPDKQPIGNIAPNSLLAPDMLVWRVDIHWLSTVSYRMVQQIYPQRREMIFSGGSYFFKAEPKCYDRQVEEKDIINELPRSLLETVRCPKIHREECAPDEVGTIKNVVLVFSTRFENKRRLYKVLLNGNAAFWFVCDPDGSVCSEIYMRAPLCVLQSDVPVGLLSWLQDSALWTWKTIHQSGRGMPYGWYDGWQLSGVRFMGTQHYPKVAKKNLLLVTKKNAVGEDKLEAQNNMANVIGRLREGGYYEELL